MILRPAMPADLPEIVRVTNAAYVVEAFCIRGDRTDLAESGERMAKGAFFVVEDPDSPGRLLGSVYASIPHPRRGYLGTLAIDPAAQSRGLARRLVEAVEAHCRKAGCAFLDLTVVNLRAEIFPFYLRLGFTATDTLPFPVPEKLMRPCHLVRMTKALLPPEQL